MTGTQLLRHQVRYSFLAFRRNPPALFFTAILPVLFLVIFAGIFGNEVVDGQNYRFATYYVPGILGLAVISATFVNLAITLTTWREQGVLKRLRGTPLSAATFLAGQVATSFAITAALVVLLVGIGRLFYGVAIPTSTLPGFLVMLFVGATAFCCLGVAMSGLIPSEEAAPPMTNAVVLPLYFISGTFFSTEQAPAWMRSVANLFPVRHLGQGLLHAFDPTTTGSGLVAADLAVIAAWGVAGLLVAVRAFRWTPR